MHLPALGARAAVALALLLAGRPGGAAAQAPSDSGRPHKSVYGKLSSVDKSLNGVVMRADDGQKMAWQFDKRVIAQLANFKPGDPMIVIYRQISPSEKRVTAVAFPGTAEKPTYVNTTGSRVLIRSTAQVDGACGGPETGPVTESILPSEGTAEVLEGCWCCAVPGESCVPGNRSGLGRAFLVNCFK